MKAFRALTAVLLAFTPALAAQAAEIFSPGLPARGSNTQFLECRIVNISNVSRTVTIQIFDSTGAIVGSPAPQLLTSGQAGGVSLTAVAAGMYCKFTVEGNANHYRASIDVLDPATDSIVVALPAE